MKKCVLFLYSCAAWGACLQVEADRITTADLAKAIPAFAQVASAEAVAYAPIPGAQRVLGAGEIRRIAAKFGLELGELSDICVEYPMQTLEPAEIASVLRTGLDNPDAHIEIVEVSKYPVPRGTLIFPKSGLQASPFSTPDSVLLWRGWQMYGSGKRYAVWARVRIWVEGERLVASRDILPGQEIAEKDLTTARVRYFPSPAEILTDAGAIVGRSAKTRIPLHTAVALSALRPKKAVVAGGAVRVDVQAPSVHLAFPAKAESEGALGDSVRVLNPATGRRFTAIVDGPNSVSVKIERNEN